MAERDAAVTTFTEDPECRILLMSLKAGGVALNLTVASHVRALFSFSVYADSGNHSKFEKACAYMVLHSSDFLLFGSFGISNFIC